MPVIEQKTTNKNKVDFDLNRLDKSKTTIFSKYPFFLPAAHLENMLIFAYNIYSRFQTGYIDKASMTPDVSLGKAERE